MFLLWQRKRAGSPLISMNNQATLLTHTEYSCYYLHLTGSIHTVFIWHAHCCWCKPNTSHCCFTLKGFEHCEPVEMLESVRTHSSIEIPLYQHIPVAQNTTPTVPAWQAHSSSLDMKFSIGDVHVMKSKLRLFCTKANSQHSYPFFMFGYWCKASSDVENSYTVILKTYQDRSLQLCLVYYLIHTDHYHHKI